MLNRESEENLKKNLIEVINNYEINKDFKEIAMKLQDRIKVGKLSDLFRQTLQLEMFQLRELYFLAKTLNKYIAEKQEKIDHINPDNLNPEKYFTPLEIKNFESFTNITVDDSNDNIIVFNNVIETVEGKQWIVGKSSAKEIAKIIYSGAIKYNYNMQRESEKIRSKGKLIGERAKVYKKSVHEIASQMISGEYKPTAISFNILKNGSEDFKYDPTTLTLTIFRKPDSEIDIIDGYHRTLGCLEALSKKEDLDQAMQINLFNFEESEAQKYIYQEALKNSIDPTLLKLYNTSNIYNLIARALNTDGNRKTNKLFNNIAVDLTELEDKNKLTTFYILQQAIEDNFKIDEEDTRARRIYKQYLIDFFNELLSILKDELVNIKISRNSNNTIQYNTFYGYVALASALYNKENWEDKLLNIIRKIDFSKENKMWKEFSIEKDKLTAKPKKAIYDYFKSLANDTVESEVV